MGPSRTRRRSSRVARSATYGHQGARTQVRNAWWCRSSQTCRVQAAAYGYEAGVRDLATRDAGRSMHRP